MYKVIGTVRSRAFRPLWMLEELGQPYELVHTTPHSPVAFEHNPQGKVPALVDGDHSLTDSVAVMMYLADKHGGLTAKSGTPERARQDAMTLWLIDEFDALLWTAAKHSFVLPKAERMPAIKDTLKSEFARNVDHFATKIAGDFVMGGNITVPDILAVHCLNWAISAKLAADNSKVADYAKRLRARPAFKAVRALDTDT